VGIHYLDNLIIFIRRHADWFASFCLFGVALIYAFHFVNFNVPPFEDAAMLMRYADHLAHGYGIVWNIGEHPVDGATDFLFMVTSAGLINIGVPVGRSVRSIAFISHLLTVLLVYLVNRKVWRANILLSFICGLYLCLGTGFSYVAAFFGTPFFAFFASLTLALGLLFIQKQKPTIGLAFLFAFSGLLTGLSRPEGVIIAFGILTTIVIMKGWHESVNTIAIFTAVFFFFGGIYFLWHWNYFGYPLPNPFYAKGGGLVYWDSFWESFGNLFRFGGPFMLAFIMGFRSPVKSRQTIAFLFPLLLFAAAFILISNETNFGGRFQYALQPMVLICWYPIVDGLPKELGFSMKWPIGVRTQILGILVTCALIFSLLKYSISQNCILTSFQNSCGVAYENDGRYDVAKYLSDYQGKGYVIATSEAGLLPFYSNWTAIDTWGLNDEWIAHHGVITNDYLDRYKPNVIVFHAYFSPLIPPRLIEKNLSQRWFRMTITLRDYAETHGYKLAAAFGDSPYESHYYYVRTDFVDSDRIVRDISTMKNYYWYVSGKKSINYASFQP
jgi:arabinofuranosyltransferase